MNSLFSRHIIYSEDDINRIAIENGLATVDCIKEENMISLEEWNGGEGGDCLFEFDRTNKGAFLLRWSEFEK